MGSRQNNLNNGNSTFFFQEYLTKQFERYKPKLNKSPLKPKHN